MTSAETIERGTLRWTARQVEEQTGDFRHQSERAVAPVGVDCERLGGDGQHFIACQIVSIYCTSFPFPPVLSPFSLPLATPFRGAVSLIKDAATSRQPAFAVPPRAVLERESVRQEASQGRTRVWRAR